MATVTSITAERAAAIEAASIVSAYLSGTNLIFRTAGGSEINVGSVKASVLDAWPVNSIFIGYTSTSPATLLGGGTWVRFAEGKFLVSQSGADTDFDTLGETGGSKTITVAMLPPHTHTTPAHVHTGTTDMDGAHTHDYSRPQATSATYPQTGATVVSDDVYQTLTTSPDGDHTHTFTTASGGGGTSGNGSGTSAAHLPPYMVVYMWRRTA